MKKFCESLREHAIKMKLLTKRNRMKMQKSVIFVKKIWKEIFQDKKYPKVIDHCHYTGEYRGTANSIRNLKYSVP